jgi:endonuclease YncB( thermonuclease family)
LTLRNFTLAPLLVVAACLCASTAFADNLSGQASIIDGDTLEIHGTRVRLWGIDAPESDQLCRNEDSTQYRCGQKAANDLDAMIARRPVSCVDLDERSYNRTVAVCTVAGTDIADWLVRNGHALDWPKYSRGAYADAQAEAKREGRGIWQGSFVEPWAYRACRREGSTIASCVD